MDRQPPLGETHPSPEADPASVTPCPAEKTVPLCVDLDGTLIQTDLLLEGCRAFLRQARFRDYRHLLALRKGRAAFKAVIAELFPLDMTALPYREPLLNFLSEQHRLREKILLVTAAHQTLARQMAEHLALFDEVLASDGSHNLKGANKGRALVQRFGEGGFDYIGDSPADLRVWPHARTAYLIGPRARRLEQVLKRKHPHVGTHVLAG